MSGGVAGSGAVPGSKGCWGGGGGGAMADGGGMVGGGGGGVIGKT